MERKRLAEDRPKTLNLPPGWQLINRFTGDRVVLLEFQRGAEYGPRVTGFGVTFEAALQFGLGFMRRYDERDRLRGPWSSPAS
jgi:hypothetical protein